MADTATTQAATIYVVEDEKIQREGLVRHLKKAGYTNITEFASVDAALEHMGWTKEAQLLGKNLPDAVITDNNTGSRYTGLFLLGTLKHTNVVKLMAAGGPDQIHVTAAGGEKARLFAKPYDEAQLLAALAQGLDQKTRGARTP